MFLLRLLIEYLFLLALYKYLSFKNVLISLNHIFENSVSLLLDYTEVFLSWENVQKGFSPLTF